jgi:hypothetical protein
MGRVAHSRLGTMSHKLCGHQAHLPGVAKLNLREINMQKRVVKCRTKITQFIFFEFSLQPTVIVSAVNMYIV